MVRMLTQNEEFYPDLMSIDPLIKLSGTHLVIIEKCIHMHMPYGF